ncbi:MAG: carboxypeptidase regulatory-like domain-containing protein, partial [Lentisphaerae bacterium]|nr:carboxypeptidase regulatory-like domain-containing protein [Lentisphaerota bacterium]
MPPATISNMVNTNLDAGYPVIFGITGNGGHAIVCDGYGYNASTMYHHLNMGWAGTDDQWYNLPNMVGDYADYNAVDTCIYNIFKTGTGEIVSGRVVDCKGDPISGATVQTDSGTFSSTTNEKGIYSLVHVTPGTYNITVTRGGYTSDTTRKTVDASVESGSTGNIWGVNFTLALGNGPPSVTTNSIGSFTGTSVFATGEVLFENGATVTERGFCWGTSTDPLITGNKLAVGSGTGQFSDTITGLTNNTRYYVRAYATNINGTSYGENLTFRATADTFPINLAIPAGWITGGWKVDETAAYDGNYSLSSGTTSDNSSNTLTYEGDFLAGTVSFKYKVSSEVGCDYLRFEVDGILKD